MTVPRPDQQHSVRQLADRPTPPTNVLAAFWLCVVTGVVWIVHVLVFMPDRDMVTASAQRAEGGVLTPQQLHTVVTMAMVLVVVFTVVIAALCVFFAWKMRAGRIWARTTLTWITGVSIIVSVGGDFWVGPVIAGLAVVAMYLPTSNAYFAAIKRAPGR
ncbi:MAG: hypothetical protein ACRDRN_18925 [Sciscionella sp.]